MGLKVTVDLDEVEDINDRLISAIADAAYYNLEIYKIKDLVSSEIFKKVAQEVDKVKLDMKNWDVDQVAFEFHKNFGKSIISSITKQVLVELKETLSKDKGFVAELAKEVIKQQFSNDK